MKAEAKFRYVRIAPRKVRLMADLVRGKQVQEARTLLRFTTRKTGDPILKLLNSAVASAKNNFEVDEANLYIAKITVDEGPKFRRYQPRARGAAYPIQKKTSHITILIEEIEKGRATRKEAPAKEKAQPESEVKASAGAESKKKAARQGQQKSPASAKREFEAEKKTKKEGGEKRIFRRKTG